MRRWVFAVLVLVLASMGAFGFFMLRPSDPVTVRAPSGLFEFTVPAGWHEAPQPTSVFSRGWNDVVVRDRDDRADRLEIRIGSTPLGISCSGPQGYQRPQPNASMVVAGEEHPARQESSAGRTTLFIDECVAPFVHVFADHRQVALNIAFTAPSEEFDENRTSLDELLASWRWLA